MKLNGHINVVWNARDFDNLEYKKDTIKTSYQLNEFAEKGHNFNNMIIYNYFEPNPMPTGVDVIKSYFEDKFDRVGVAVNMFTPGTYVPFHHDLYQRFKKVNNLSPDKNVYRFIVMLEDGAHGQMLQIGNQVHYQWKAGDYFGWIDGEIHASYNMSLHNRYAIQVTTVK